MKLASIIRTLCRPRSFFKHSANNSLDSGAATIQLAGGSSHLSQSLQKCKVASRCIPWEISTVSFTQSKQSAPVLWVPSIAAPQLQQRMLGPVSRYLLWVDTLLTLHYYTVDLWTEML